MIEKCENCKEYLSDDTAQICKRFRVEVAKSNCCRFFKEKP